MSRWGRAALLLLPGALTVYLSFNAGGFFPNTPAFVALVLVAAIALRVIFAPHPFEGWNPVFGIAAGGLALFAVWTLCSAIWSDALGRSLIEFDRALMYLLAFVLYGSIAKTSEDLRWMVRGLALAFTAVALAALATRVLPDVWTIAPNIANNRLSYPLTYWNALGLLVSLGGILCFHLTASLREPPVVRVLAAAALPALGAAVLFTFSRGGIGAGIIGLVVYAIVGRPLGLASGLLATGPATAIAVVAAYDADLLASADPTSNAAVAQGHDVALVVALCMAGAALVRALLLLLDARLLQIRLPDKIRRRASGGLAVAAVAAAVVLTVVFNVPGEIGDQYDRFVDGRQVGEVGDLRSRLTDPGNNGRIDQWEAAIDGFQAAPVHGEGAGTYEFLWAEHRPVPSHVIDAHSLYAEVLGELGIVGVVLLAIPLLLILAAALNAARAPNRSVYAAILAAAVAWVFHAGIDWDWEMPAVSLWLFAAGGALLARAGRELPRFGAPRLPVRAIVVAACLGLAVVPGLVLASQARLDDSVDRFEAGDCPGAIEAARDSSSILGARAEPYEVVAYCELRSGSPRRAVTAANEALDRDPDNWKYHYALALAQAGAGQDPGGEARAAQRLNPLDPSTVDLVRRFRTHDKRLRRQRAHELVELAFQ